MKPPSQFPRVAAESVNVSELASRDVAMEVNLDSVVFVSSLTSQTWLRQEPNKEECLRVCLKLDVAQDSAGGHEGHADTHTGNLRGCDLLKRIMGLN